MKTCSTCKHWNSSECCEAPNLPYEVKVVSKPFMEILPHNGYDGADLSTSANFGCVLHEDKE